VHVTEKVRIFYERYKLVGPIVWILCLQYFIAQYFVASAWERPHSIIHNPISDLGNTACGVYAERFVCSPLSGLMNVSFVSLGGFMVLGSILIFQGFKKSNGSFAGFSLMGLAGVGAVLVGLFPENTIGFLHGLGAFMAFFFGNVAIVILGAVLNMHKSMRYYTLFSGIFALIALFLFGTQNYLGLGEGGMERLAGYPQTLWLIVFGVYVSANRYNLKHLPH
jgi:hypothetical membrane protein